jgi:hypothetical protein
MLLLEPPKPNRPKDRSLTKCNLQVIQVRGWAESHIAPRTGANTRHKDRPWEYKHPTPTKSTVSEYKKKPTEKHIGLPQQKKKYFNTTLK